MQVPPLMLQINEHQGLTAASCPYRNPAKLQDRDLHLPWLTPWRLRPVRDVPLHVGVV